MVPDDDLFPVDEGTPTEGAPSGGEAQRNGGVSLTRDEVDGFANQLAHLQQNQATIQGNSAQLTQMLQNVQGTLERLGLTGEGTGGESGELDATTFLTDPESAVRRVAAEMVQQGLREQAGPLLGQLVEQAHRSTVDEEKSNIVAEFGEEAWNNVFLPTLQPIFDRTRAAAPSQLGNKEAISNAVSSIKGRNFAALVDMRNAAQESRSKTAEAEQMKAVEFVRSNLTGGIGRSTPGRSVTDEMRDHLDREQRETGVRPDEKVFLAAVNSGPTLSDFLETRKGAA